MRQLDDKRHGHNAQFSPDGTKIAYSDREFGQRRRVDHEGRWLAEGAGHNLCCPRPTPRSRDGNKLAFTGERRESTASPYYDVYRLNAGAPYGSAVSLTNSRLAGDGGERWDYFARAGAVNNTILITEGVNRFDGNVGRAPS